MSHDRQPYEGAPTSYLPSYQSRPLPSTTTSHQHYSPFLINGVPFYKHLLGSPARSKRNDRDAPQSPTPVRVLVPDDFGVLPEDLANRRNVQLLNTSKSYKRAGLAITDEFSEAWSRMKRAYGDTRKHTETHGVDMVRIILELCPRARVYCIPVFRSGSQDMFEDGMFQPLDDAISGLSLKTYSSDFRRPRVLDMNFLIQVIRAAASQSNVAKRMHCICLGYAGKAVDEVLRDEIADAAGLGQIFFATPCCDAGRGIKHIFPGAYGIRGVAAVAAVRVDLEAFRMAKFRAVSSVVTMGAFGGKGTLLPVPITEDRSRWKVVSGASFVAAEIIGIAAGVIQKYATRFGRDPVGLENYLMRVLGKSVLDPSILHPDPETGLTDDGTRFGIPSFSEIPLDALMTTWREKVHSTKRILDLQQQVKRLRSELAAAGGGRGGARYEDFDDEPESDGEFSEEVGDPDLETTW